MQNYIVQTAALPLKAGSIVQLSEHQAKIRNSLIKALGPDGVYELLVDMQFKKGEIIGYQGDLPKVLVSKVLPTEADIGTQSPDTVVEPLETEEETEEFLEIKTVSDLAKIAKMKIKDTIQMLKDDYAFEAESGKTELPESIISALIDGGVLEGEPGEEKSNDA